MEIWTHASIQWLLAALALPKVGLSAIFVVSLVSATLLPLGSEPAVFAYAKNVPDMFWPAIIAATVGNTLGGVITYCMGLGAEKAFERWKEKHERAAGHGQAVRGRRKPAGPLQMIGGRWHLHISQWVRRLGPSALFFSWLPVVGDPLCAVGGWLKLPFWPSVFYMALGKFLRYVAMTAGLLWVFPNLS